jgi:hypothetical protein
MPPSSSTLTDGPDAWSTGAQLCELVEATERSLLLVAPFVKKVALDRVLERCGAVELTCVTRWHPMEIASGVSDLDAYRTIRDRGGRFLLRQDLHAKYFRGDATVLIGSANVTSRALGWASMPNLELLVRLDGDAQMYAAFEDRLFEAAFAVDDALFDSMRAIVEALDVPTFDAELSLPEPDPDSAVADARWWAPRLRYPEDLYRAYLNLEDEALPGFTRVAAEHDLAMLQIPAGLPRDAFYSAVAGTLLLLPLVQFVDRLVTVPQRFGYVRDEISSRLELDREEADRTWQTLIRWIKEFLPERYQYSRPRYSEVISRR